MRKMLVYTERLNLFISKDQKIKLKEIADKKIVSISDIIRFAIDEYLQNHVLEDK